MSRVTSTAPLFRQTENLNAAYQLTCLTISIITTERCVHQGFPNARQLMEVAEQYNRNAAKGHPRV
jgi:hypothetical protein